MAKDYLTDPTKWFLPNDEGVIYASRMDRILFGQSFVKRNIEGMESRVDPKDVILLDK